MSSPVSSDSKTQLTSYLENTDVLSLESGVVMIALSRDNRELACALDNHTITVLDLENQKPLKSLGIHEDKITGLAYSTPDDSEYLVSSGLDKRVVVWGFPDEKSANSVTYRDKIIGLSCSREWFTGNFGQYFLLWRFGHANRPFAKKCPVDDSSSTIALRERILVTGQGQLNSEKLLIWDTESSANPTKYKSPATLFHSAISSEYVAASTIPYYPESASLSSDSISTILIYNRQTDSGYQFHRYGQVTSLAFSDNKLIYLNHAGSDSTLVIRNLETKQEHLYKIRECGAKTSLIVREHFILMADGSPKVRVFDMRHLEAKKEHYIIS